MVDHRRIMTLLNQGRSYRDIVEAVGCSHRDVATARRTITEHHLDAAGLAGTSDAELAALFPDRRATVSMDYDPPDFGRVVTSMKANPHFTLLQAWRTYLGAGSSLRKYGYSQYCHLFGDYALKNDLVATLHHEPGRAMFVDWAGDTLPLVDVFTGQAVKAYLFIAVLPFSGYVYARASTDMRSEAWLGAHVGALEFFGGVPQIIVPDNTLTATHRKAKGDAARFLNERYRQLAEHYGTAIVPARVRRPRDKAAVESAVNTLNKRVIGYLAEDTFNTLAELNEAITERVVEVNHELRRRDGSTRFEQFTAEEATALSPLPELAFEQVDWKEVKVGRNYHVTTDYQHYSVPFALAGHLLRLRLTGTRVTVFDGQQVIAEHPRKLGRKGQYSTDPVHVPHQHRNVAGLWSRDWFRDRARVFGPATVQVIEQVLDRRLIEAQGYLDCQNILETLGKKNKQKLEAACQELLNSGGHPGYSTLKRLMAAIGSDASKPAPLSPAASNRKKTLALDAQLPDVFVRGADYYRDGR